jgi:hypothetical protein
MIRVHFNKIEKVSSVKAIFQILAVKLINLSKTQIKEENKIKDKNKWQIVKIVLISIIKMSLSHLNSF